MQGLKNLFIKNKKGIRNYWVSVALINIEYFCINNKMLLTICKVWNMNEKNSRKNVAATADSYKNEWNISILYILL